MKPTAPVDVTLTARPYDNGIYEVTLFATPRADARWMRLSLRAAPEAIAPPAEARAEVGPIRAGSPRILRARVEAPPGSGRDVVATAEVAVGTQIRTRAAVLRVGAPLPHSRAAPIPTREVLLPTGERVVEVRP